MLNKKLTSIILALTMCSTIIVLPRCTANANTKIQANKTSPYKITKEQKSLLDTYNPIYINYFKKSYAPVFSNFFKTEEAILKTAKKHGVSNYLIHSYNEAIISTDFTHSYLRLNGEYSTEEHHIYGHYNIKYTAKDQWKNKFKQSMKDMLKI